jgi:curved DNA-binding protein CbpA
VQRIYRLLARRFHPDNRESGSDERFREVRNAYEVLGDPASRAAYDVAYFQTRQFRWRLMTEGGAEGDIQYDQAVRLRVLEILRSSRRVEPNHRGLFISDLVELTGTHREHLEYTIWYLVQKDFVVRGDSSHIMITVAGIDHLEANFEQQQRRRLTSGQSEESQFAAS